MGKKKADLMAQQRELFVDGCHKNGVDGKLAVALFDKIETFAGYGFNKSHSMAYAYVAYQTAYLKANYPVEFMAALLTSESGNLDKIANYVEECKRLSIDVLPPDINRSRLQFTPDGNTIRFGLGAVKNVGKGPAEAIVVEREANGPYKDIYDFCSRIEPHYVNRRVVESLNKTGAFLSTGWNRAQADAVLENALSEASIAHREKESGQGSLLDLLGGDDLAQSMHEQPVLDEWPEKEILAHEKELIGLFISSHPLDKYRDNLDQFTTSDLGDLSTKRNGQELNVGGLVGSVKIHVTQKGKKMAFLTIDTLDGPCEVTVFSDTYENASPLLVPDAPIVVRAHVNFRNGEAGLIADDIMSMDDAAEKLTRAVHIRMSNDGEKKDDVINELAHLLGENPGACDVYLHCNTPENDEVTVHATSSCMVAPSAQLKGKIEALLGTECMWYSAGNGLPRHG
jgi:DNA polymerase-3 subunit alpha